MKRRITAILLTGLMVLSLTACGGSKETPASKAPETTTPEMTLM